MPGILWKTEQDKQMSGELPDQDAEQGNDGIVYDPGYVGGE